ncbi:Oligopeptide-binding protein AppA precursor [Pelotomaculum schinkii]|uniref:Oligopeptide-binding protein AppA n=1 Tax=Pelotomaculum schinkii TaxID=78350 RepID=A0A4Y7RHW5_9FIRM|nr:ABC transporter substrate-binding protein [Pelotomaculum schinkii]TEB08391.1 Oligopeptide-binding protein AppA precursor [Pelotomaculum schinkii]
MKTKRIIALFLVMVFMIASLTACGSTPTTSQADPNKHLTVGLWYFGDGLDPTQSWNGWTLSRTAVGETLVKLDANSKIVGVLADRWENVDAATWKIHIRDGVTFQNGNPVTAEAVKSSLERALKLCDRATSLLPVKSITASGQDLTITTTEPYGALLGNIADPLFTIIDTSVELTNVNTAPVCTGPFKAVSYTLDKSIEVESYDNYWGGASPLGKVTYVLIRDGDTRTSALQSGDVDVAQAIDVSSLSLFENNPDYTISKVPSTRTALIWLNFSNPILADINVRKALAYSLNREELSGTLLGGIPATGPFSSSLPFGNDKLSAYDYNLDKAKQLMADSGLIDKNGDGYVEKNGKDVQLKLVIKKGTDNSTEASYLQSVFAKIGLKVIIEMADDNLAAMADKNVAFDIGVGNINTGTTGDPQYFLELYFKRGASENYGHYSNTELDSLIGKLATEMDTQTRCNIAAQAQQMILDDCPYLFMAYTNNNVVCKSNITGVEAYPIDFYLMNNTVDIK